MQHIVEMTKRRHFAQALLHDMRCPILVNFSLHLPLLYGK